MKRYWLPLCVLFLMVATMAVAGEAVPKLPPPPKSFLKQISAQLLALTVLVAGPVLGMGFAALMLLAAATSPERVRRVDAILQRGRWATIIVGVVTAAAIVLLAGLVGEGLKAVRPGLAGILSVTLLGGLLWLGVYGLAGTAQGLGERLGGKGAVTGAGALGGLLCVPVVGWLLFLYFLCRGVGACTLTFIAPARDAGVRDGESPVATSTQDSDVPRPSQ